MPRSRTTLRCLSSTMPPFDDAPSSSWASPAVVAASSPPQGDRIRVRSSVRTASRACLAAVLAQCAVSPLTCDWDASSLASRRRSRRRRRRSFHALGAGSSRSPGADPLGPGAAPSSVSTPPDRPGRRRDTRPPIRACRRSETGCSLLLVQVSGLETFISNSLGQPEARHSQRRAHAEDARRMRRSHGVGYVR